MSAPTPLRPAENPPLTGTFDTETALGLIARFCAAHDVARGTRYSVVARLDRALGIAAHVGPDRRWQRLARWSGNRDIDDVPGTVSLKDQRDILYNMLVADLPEAPWLPPNTVVSVSRWARFCPHMRAAERLGLGWILPINGEVLLVPMPTVRHDRDNARVLHCETGRPAIEWSDGTGPFYLHGCAFAEALYREIIGGHISIRRIAGIRTADQRAIALRYLTFDQAEAAGARPVDDSVYRLALPPKLAGDRRLGYARTLYFTRLGDSAAIQWIDPQTHSDKLRSLVGAEVQEAVSELL